MSNCCHFALCDAVWLHILHGLIELATFSRIPNLCWRVFISCVIDAASSVQRDDAMKWHGENNDGGVGATRDAMQTRKKVLKRQQSSRVLDMCFRGGGEQKCRKSWRQVQHLRTRGFATV